MAVMEKFEYRRAQRQRDIPDLVVNCLRKLDAVGDRLCGNLAPLAGAVANEAALEHYQRSQILADRIGRGSTIRAQCQRPQRNARRYCRPALVDTPGCDLS